MGDSFKVKGADGVDLHTYAWLPDGEPLAVVQIAHGMAEHALRYRRFAAALNGAGYAVYANDHRGHGLSVSAGERPGHMGDGDGWNKAVQDLKRVNEAIMRRHPGIPIVLLGHSMGSFLAQQYIREYGDSIAAVALSATNGPPGILGQIGRLVSRLERWRHGPRGHSALLAGMTFKAFNKPFAPNRTEFDWLSRDPAEVDKYVADPLCGFEVTTGTWVGMLDALTRIASNASLAGMNKEMPIYVFSGTEDPVGERGKGVKRLLAAYKRHGFRNVTHRFYDGGRHELLNETDRDRVTADFISWLVGDLGLDGFAGRESGQRASATR